MVWSLISDWPKVSTLSLKTPMMVKGMPLTVMLSADGRAWAAEERDLANGATMTATLV